MSSPPVTPVKPQREEADELGEHVKVRKYPADSGEKKSPQSAKALLLRKSARVFVAVAILAFVFVSIGVCLDCVTWSLTSIACAYAASVIMTACCVVPVLLTTSKGSWLVAALPSLRGKPILAKGVQHLVPKGLSVNYFITRQCNYACGFCFHTAKTSSMLTEEQARRGLHMLHERGMQKINFVRVDRFQ